MKIYSRKQEKINFCREIELNRECTEDMDWYESEYYANYRYAMEKIVYYSDVKAEEEYNFYFQAYQDIVSARKIQMF